MHVVPCITYRYKPPIRFLQHTIVSRSRPHKCQISEITISLRPNLRPSQAAKGQFLCGHMVIAVLHVQMYDGILVRSDYRQFL